MNQEMWDQVVAFHGHACPGLAIGYKACEAVIEKMGAAAAADEELVCVTENDACGVDAIQALLRCTIGKGNLIYKGTGKQVFSFFSRATGKNLRLYLKAKNPGLDKAAWLSALLDLPVEEVFSFGTPKFDLPERARLFTSVSCEICGESAAEHQMRLQGGKKVCLDCFEEYRRGW